MAGVRVAHRVLPVAFACYEYDKIRKSQNIIENSLLLLIASCLPPGCKPVFVVDRGEETRITVYWERLKHAFASPQDWERAVNDCLDEESFFPAIAALLRRARVGHEKLQAEAVRVF